MGVVSNLLTAIGSTALIIACGYVCKRTHVFTKKHAEGLNRFVSTIALPAVFFYSLATMNRNGVNFGVLGAMIVAKALIHLCTSGITYFGASGDANRLGTMGIYTIFATQSNDVALGVPIIASTFGKEYVSYIFLFAPFQLLFLNVVSLILLELNAQKGGKNGRSIQLSNESVDVRGDLQFGERKGGKLARSENSKVVSPISHDGSDFHSEQKFLDDSKSSGDMERNYSDDVAEDEESLWKVWMNVTVTLLKSPLVISCILGILVNQIVEKRQIPLFIQDFFEALSTCYGGCTLFALGVAISIQKSTGEATTISCLTGVKVILMPLVMAVFAKLLTGDSTDTEFAFIYGMLPTAPTAFVIASKYGVREKVAAGGILVSLMLSVPCLILAGAALDSKSESYDSANGGDSVPMIISSYIASCSLALCALTIGLGTLMPRRIRGQSWVAFLLFVACCAGWLTTDVICDSAETGYTDVMVLDMFNYFFHYFGNGVALILVLNMYWSCRGYSEKLKLLAKWGYPTILGCSALMIGCIAFTRFTPIFKQSSWTGVGMRCEYSTNKAAELVKFLFEISALIPNLFFILQFQKHLGFQKQIHSRLESREDDLADNNYSLMGNRQGGTNNDCVISYVSQEIISNFERYSVVLTYNVGGIVLMAIIYISNVFLDDDDNGVPAYTLTVFVFTIGFKVSIGFVIFIACMTDRALREPLDHAWKMSFGKCDEYFPCCLEGLKWLHRSCFRGGDKENLASIAAQATAY